MYDNFMFTLLGAVLGWLVSHLYAKQSSKELKQQFENIEGYLKRIENEVRPIRPKLADQIADALKSRNFTGAEPTVIGEGDPCPQCGKTALKFTNWGNGPLGPSNAWYQCGNCHYRFQTMESSGE